MKVKLLPLAIGAAIAMPGVALAEGPTVYGKMNVTYEMADFDTGTPAVDGDTWELNSNASRLGVKGSEEISDSLTAFYKAEYEIFVDDGAKSASGEDDNGDEFSYDKTFSQRDIYVGLKGGWGSVKLGNFDTPLKKSQGKVDQFNDMSAGDLKNVLSGENRESNLIQYSSPKIAEALTLNLAIQPGEEVCGSGADPECQDGTADNFSVSAVFKNDMFYAALGMDDGIDGMDTIRLTGTMNMDAFTFGLLYQTAEESEGNNPDEEEGYILSAAMKLGAANKIRFQYGFSEWDNVGAATTTTDEITQIGLGFDHKLSKQTKLFANYIMLEEEAEGAANADEETRLQFGVEHKF